jgi:hypothetical protein
MNNWTIFHNFQEKEKSLENFLTNELKKKLNNKRIFYIVRSNLDKNILKFGISDGNGFHRLTSYIHSYGKYVPSKHSGIGICFLAGVNKKEEVQWKNSQVYRMEVQVKKELSKQNLIVKNRGSERTSATIKEIESIMQQTKVKDIETILRRSDRNIKTQELRRSDRIKNTLFF